MYFEYNIVVVETNQLNYSLAKTRRLGVYVDRGKLRKPTPTISCMFSHHLNSLKIFSFLNIMLVFTNNNTVVFFSILPITSWERNTPIHRYPTPLIFSIMSFLLHKFPTWCSIGSMFSSMWGKTFKKVS